ncbi:Peptidoglycan/LPS O-acetylase OafA/YrhL, contains acyltransferase and SGNH-hydrolase domains [Duganella sp. CF517]|uniref:acyltransferase family protein n=1 Tax=Duganella sp. CF517 TaxID=1881038 RepID=UPI0008D6366D|nr:acyltransferase [Duganella sp. CF517]SEO57873.1 Peptidoglycan/LPS O-acetylase OafA/YrhL, contains acyltransferase and SGNH-hydrolase domains [Duganella sp. CF517]
MTLAVKGASGAEQRPPSQFGLINLLKAGAAQLIVLHHLAFYGPMADHVRPLLPELIGWLGDSARIAVQAFLVIGGFLAAKSLAPTGHAGLADPIGAIWRRYAKLAPPFMVATLLAAAASMLAGKLMAHDSISEPATFSQLAAHALLLHGVLGYPSLSAGAWYVAIDFQLYALMALLLWFGGRLAAGRRPAWLMPGMVALAVTLSLVYFNLDADWDNWAPYFFGSYGLGLMAWWAGDPRRKPGAAALLVGMAFLPVIFAQALDFRSRIALAMAVACVLVLFGRAKTTSTGQGWSLVNGLARISYSVFLIHFPVCLLVNAAFTRFVPPEPELQAFGMLVAWAASLAAGAVFFRCVEAPLARLVQRVVGQAVMRPSSA